MKNNITLKLATAANPEGVQLEFIVKDLGNKKAFYSPM